VRARTCYIVHLEKHALFVEVGAARGKWRIYDQSGVHTKQDAAWLERVGGYGRQQVKAIVQITYAEPAPATLATLATPPAPATLATPPAPAAAVDPRRSEEKRRA